MIKLLLTLIMMFTFGTSTVNAEEDTTSIKDRIDELAEIKSDSQSAIKTKIDKLSEGELKTIIANVNELTEPTEDDLVIKEAATNKLEEMKSVEKSNLLAVGIGVGVFLVSSQWLNESATYCWITIDYSNVTVDKMMIFMV